MIQFLESPDDVLAFTLEGRVSGADLDAAMDRLEWCMGNFPTVHLYMETHAITGMEIAAWPHHAARSLPLLTSLNRFGRVAVVADQAWIRGWTRVESALVPCITYRTCTPAERNEAFGWVTGKAAAEPVARAA
jgi:hypothetical protein